MVTESSSPKKSALYKWITPVEKAQDDVEDEGHSGRSSPSACEGNINLVCILIEKDQ